MIIDKINLQKNFNTIPGVTENCLLRFRNDGILEAVSSSSQGILPQIKVIASISATVQCRNSNNQVISQSASTSTSSYKTIYFNVPSIGTYTVSINNSSNTVNITSYRQYVVNSL